MKLNMEQVKRIKKRVIKENGEDTPEYALICTIESLQQENKRLQMELDASIRRYECMAQGQRGMREMKKDANYE